MVHHLPKGRDRRRATSKPDGRRHDSWVCMRHAARHQLGDGTIVLSKKRRNLGPKRVTIIVPNFLDASEGTILSHEAWRWGVELPIKALQSGLHVGRMQVTHEVDRVTRSVVLPVCASLVLLHVYSGKDGVKDTPSQDGSLFRLKQRCPEDVMQDQVQRVEQKWRRKWKKNKEAA
jgi:hypothetical protein